MKIAVLMTCHNRKELTLRCLRSLAGAAEGRAFDVSVFLTDDGCTDGTAAAVLNVELGIAVHVVAGSGNDYWAKGMARAWRASGNDYDYFLWLNDDVVLYPDALEGLTADALCNFSAPSVVVGSCVDDTGRCIYGAVDACGVVIDPAKRGGCAALHWFNGNVVLVPRWVCLKAGIISDEYSHGRADYDYAERLRRAGIPFSASSRIVGVCEYNYDPSMRGITRMDRMRKLFEPGYWNLHDLWLFRSRYYGKVRAVVSCAHHVLNAVW